MNNNKAPPKTRGMMVCVCNVVFRALYEQQEGPSKENGLPKIQDLVHQPLSTTTTTTSSHQAPSFHFGMPPNPMAKPLFSSYVYLRVCDMHAFHNINNDFVVFICNFKHQGQNIGRQKHINRIQFGCN